MKLRDEKKKKEEEVCYFQIYEFLGINEKRSSMKKFFLSVSVCFATTR